MQRQARVGQPFGKFRDRLRALVIEVGSRCEEFDDLESVRGNVHQVVAAEPVFVEEMCGDAELIHGVLAALARDQSLNSSLAKRSTRLLPNSNSQSLSQLGAESRRRGCLTKRRDREDRRALEGVVCRVPSGPRYARRGSRDAGSVSVLVSCSTLTQLA